MTNEKILQIIPAPSKLYAMFESGSAIPVVCLALVQRADGSRDVALMTAGGDSIDFAEISEDYIGVYMDER